MLFRKNNKFTENYKRHGRKELLRWMELNDDMKKFSMISIEISTQKYKSGIIENLDKIEKIQCLIDFRMLTLKKVIL